MTTFATRMMERGGPPRSAPQIISVLSDTCRTSRPSVRNVLVEAGPAVRGPFFTTSSHGTPFPCTRDVQFCLLGSAPAVGRE